MGWVQRRGGERKKQGEEGHQRRQPRQTSRCSLSLARGRDDGCFFFLLLLLLFPVRRAPSRSLSRSGAALLLSSAHAGASFRTCPRRVRVEQGVAGAGWARTAARKVSASGSERVAFSLAVRRRRQLCSLSSFSPRLCILSLSLARALAALFLLSLDQGAETDLLGELGEVDGLLPVGHGCFLEKGFGGGGGKG